MSIEKLSVDDRLGKDRYKFDEESHIEVQLDKCVECVEKPCLLVCPAEVYEYHDDKIVYRYENCLECGSCVIACHSRGKGAITWHNPRGGYGINYRYG